MSQLKAMKFRVESPEHSEKIQKKLFKMGYKWYCGPILQFLDAPFLFADEEGGLGWGMILNTSSMRMWQGIKKCNS